MKPKSVIICGQDRCGKSTLQKNLFSEFMRHGHIPTFTLHTMNFKTDDIRGDSEKLYRGCFELMKTQNCIFDRCHLGETVYSPMYRGYSGDYVFDIENDYLDEDITLILLVDTIEDLLKRDDGLSLSNDPLKMEQEKQMFLSAFEKSKIKKKFIVNINEFDHDTKKVFDYVKGLLF